MPSFNKVLLIGNLTRDPQIKTVNNTLATFGIAVNRKWRDRDGNPQEETTFVDCEAWGRTAEIIGEYLTKGSCVHIEGRLKLDQWEDKDGNKRSKLQVTVESLQMMDSKGSGQSSEPAQRRAPVGAGSRPTAADEYPDHMQDEPPF